jgi:hypothetical protein
MTEFFEKSADNSIKPVDNSVKPAKFRVSKFFLFLARLNRMAQLRFDRIFSVFADFF